MKEDLLFNECLKNVSPEVMEEVSLNIDIANRIFGFLKEKGITQRKFAEMMGKRESEISRWLTGSHGFTTKTLAKISIVLGERIVDIPRKQEMQYVFIPLKSPYINNPKEAQNGTYTERADSPRQITWN